ncbi:MAG: family transposase [Solirubrobacterales bacterium]|nr:family transposase [Solirubrobacterales bacterium]
MGIHANAKLGRGGRRELVWLMRAGSTERKAAACISVAPATAHRWSVRERLASVEERASGGWALDASSRPRRSPRRTDPIVERRVMAARERTGWGPRLIAGETGVAHSTVHAILRRHGCSRAPRAARREVCRYEWPCPGDLLHIDVKRYPRFARPGHAVTGDRSKTAAEVRDPLGHDYFHAVVDDHSRLAYGELLDDERAATTTAFFERAIAWFADHGIKTRRVMTDGAWSYTRNRSLHELLATHGIRQIVTPPYTPRWNGKVERFHQTMEREWAKGLRYRNHHARNHALPHWLAHYNERRPHSSIGGRPPISRAHNLSGQDS